MKSKSLIEKRIQLLAIFLYVFSWPVFAEQERIYEFLINESNLPAAIKEFAVQADLQIMYPTDDLDSDRKVTIRGRYTVRQALERMLSGTDLVYRFDNDKNVAIRFNDEANGNGDYVKTVNDTLSKKETHPKKVNNNEMLVAQNTQAQAQAAKFVADRQRATGPKSILEEVVVTAEKRAVSLQKIPISVSALSAEQLDQGNLLSPIDLSGQVPGLLITKADSFKRILVIRGLGWEANQNALSTPSVSIHQDGVFRPSVFSTFHDFLDVNRIEVLRGPQGTVFGQNSTGGAINIVTNQPELGEFYGNADLTIGTFDLLKTRAVLNVPIADNLSARAALQYYERDGFAKIVDTSIAGTELDEASNFTGRFQVFWQPYSNLDHCCPIEFMRIEVVFVDRDLMAAVGRLSINTSGLAARTN